MFRFRILIVGLKKWAEFISYLFFKEPKARVGRTAQNHYHFYSLSFSYWSSVDRVYGGDTNRSSALQESIY